jgi:ERCC4-related helicase
VGNYAYTSIIKLLEPLQFGYRVVALTATPGNTPEQIQEVLTNLQIASMHCKSDNDPDIRPYTNTRHINPIIIPPSAVLSQIDSVLAEFVSWPLQQLVKFGMCDRMLARGKYGFNANCYYLVRQQVEERVGKLPMKVGRVVHAALLFLKFVVDAQSLVRYAGFESFRRKFIDELEGRPDQ